ncbi:DUF2274 domain-containing protein [Paraburkholderia aspalathi]|nr:DUF2274 domain-containing protein [Paraburkholderia aspalathi]MBK3780045.1 DUF2274 domain-containing protein [Paraburkholderia aspalathi]
MKLTHIPVVEKTAKRSFSFKQSTVEKLAAYHEMYQEFIGAKVDLKDVVERMLLDFMEADKDFQKSAKPAPKGGKGDAKGGKPEAPAAESDAKDEQPGVPAAAASGGVGASSLVTSHGNEPQRF